MSNKPKQPRGPGGKFARAGESEKLHPPSTRKKISASQYWAEAEARIAADTPFPIQDQIIRVGHNPDSPLGQINQEIELTRVSVNEAFLAEIERDFQKSIDDEASSQLDRAHRMKWIGITLGIALLAMLIVAAIAWPR